MRHKLLTNWARQLIIQVRAWLPNRRLVVVADSSYAALELLAAAQGLLQPVTMVTRLRLDAALYDPAPPCNPRSTRASAQEGGAPTHPGHPLGRPSDKLDRTHRRLVRPHHPHRPAGDRHCRLVSLWAAARHHPLGADYRSRGQVPTAGIALHRCRGCRSTNPRTVCSSPAPRTTTTHTPGCLVCEGSPDVFRYLSLCAPTPLARHHFTLGSVRKSINLLLSRP